MRKNHKDGVGLFSHMNRMHNLLIGLLQRASAVDDALDHVYTELRYMSSVLHDPKVSGLMDSTVIVSCSTAEKALARARNRLVHVMSQLDTCSVGHLLATRDIQAMELMERRKMLVSNEREQKTVQPLEMVEWSLRRLAKGRPLVPRMKVNVTSQGYVAEAKNSSRYDANTDSIHMDSSSLCDDVAANCRASVEAHIAEWITLKELELELGSEVRAILTSDHKPTSNELETLSFAIKELVTSAESDVEKLRHRVSSARAELGTEIETSQALLGDVEKLTAAIQSLEQSIQHVHDKQALTYRHAVQKLMEQFSMQRQSDQHTSRVRAVEDSLKQRQEELEEYERGVHHRFLADPVHKRIHQLSEDHIKPTVGCLAATIAARSAESSRTSGTSNHHIHNSAEEVHKRRENMVLEAIDDAGVRNMIRKKRRSEQQQLLLRGGATLHQNSEVSMVEDDFIVVRDTADGNKVKLVQVLSSKDGAKWQYPVSVDMDEFGQGNHQDNNMSETATFVVDRSCRNLPPLRITVVI